MHCVFFHYTETLQTNDVNALGLSFLFCEVEDLKYASASWDGGAWWAAVYGVAQSRTQYA